MSERPIRLLDWRTRESPEARELLEHFLAQSETRDHLQSVKILEHRLITALAPLIARECPQIRFTSSAMIAEYETRPEVCAQELLCTVPLYHGLVGSSFDRTFLRDRRLWLEAHGMINVDYWTTRAREAVIAVLRDPPLLPIRKVSKDPLREGKRR